MSLGLIMKRLVLVFGLIIILSSLVSAVDPLEIEINAVCDEAIPTGEAVFEVVVRNNLNKQDRFNVYEDPVGVAPFSDIFEKVSFNESNVVVDAFDFRLIEMKIGVTKNVMPNRNYAINIFAKSLTNSNVRTKEQVIVRVIKPENVILIEPKTLELSPGDNAELEFKFENILRQDFERVEVYVTADFLEFQQTMRIAPHQIRTDKFVIPMTEIAVAGEHVVNVRVYDGQTIIGEKDFSLYVRSAENVEEKIEHSKFLLNKIIKVIKTNDGNVLAEEVYQFRVSGFKRLITGYKPEPTLTGRNLIWRFDLEPGESFTIIIEEKYNNIALIVIILLLLGGVVYYWTKKDICVEKKVYRIGDEKGIGEVKIMLTVANKTKFVFRNVKVVDIIPGLIKPVGDYGTLKPNKNMVGDKIRSLMWTLPVLDKGEERILTYKVKPTLNIVGRVVLPGAMVKYVKKGKDCAVKSNSVILESEE